METRAALPGGEIPVRLSRTPKSVAKLGADGTWSPVEFSRRDPDTLVLATPLRYRDPCVFALTFKWHLRSGALQFEFDKYQDWQM